MRVNLAPTAPNRLTARYPLVSLADPPSLLEERGFSGHRLGASDVPRLEAYIRRQGEHRAYVVLTDGQQNYGLLNGLLPAGSVAGLTAALERTRDFRLVYRRPTAWIFEFVPDVPRGGTDRPQVGRRQ
jgi:secreted PhoX family phosphatase